jgi:DNA-directed RNA polymerase delta subunit
MNGQNEIISSFINGKSKIKKFSKSNIERLELESFAKSVFSNYKYPVSHDEIINGVATFEAITKSIKKNGKKVFIKK